MICFLEGRLEEQVEQVERSLATLVSAYFYTPGFKQSHFDVVLADTDTSVDPNSSKDHLLARGLPDDLEFRTAFAQKHGITFEPGSQAFGDAVRNAIMREWPL